MQDSHILFNLLKNKAIGPNIYNLLIIQDLLNLRLVDKSINSFLHKEKIINITEKPFNYGFLLWAQDKCIARNNYIFQKVDNFFYVKLQYNSSKKLENNIYDEAIKHGWKIHISVNDSIEKNLTKAWNIVVNIFMQEQVGCFKLIPPSRMPLHKEKGKFLNRSNSYPIEVLGLEAGKQITIYACRQPNLDWDAVIVKITKKFIEAGIAPSCLPFGNKAVAGNPYFSYRNDLRPDGEYMNVTGYHNPFQYEEIFKFSNTSYEFYLKIPKWSEITGENELEKCSIEKLNLGQYQEIKQENEFPTSFNFSIEAHEIGKKSDTNSEKSSSNCFQRNCTIV